MTYGLGGILNQLKQENNYHSQKYYDIMRTLTEDNNVNYLMNLEMSLVGKFTFTDNGKESRQAITMAGLLTSKHKIPIK